MITVGTAKQLKSAGWNKETKEYYYEYETGEASTCVNDGKSISNYAFNFPKPSTDELLVELPYKIYDNKEYHAVFYFIFGKTEKYYKARYGDNEGLYMDWLDTEDKVSSEVLAQLWLKLKKEGLLK